jgi:hypothetical protein
LAAKADRFRFPSQAMPQQIAAAVKFLPCARAYFLPIHAGDARQLVVPS